MRKDPQCWKHYRSLSGECFDHEAIKRLSPDEIETHGIIFNLRGFRATFARFALQVMGSHSTGITQNPKIENHTSLHCFGCGKSFNPLQLCALHYGLERSRDFPSHVEKICTDFEIPIEYEEFAFHSSSRSSSRNHANSRLSTPKS